jgi:superfamily II DNA or RNA helicase/HKD family nuclease
MPHNFITNADAQTLKKRLQELIHHSRELKFLVGFFYFSGWRALYDAIQERDDLTIKILVGLDVEQRLGRALEIARESDTLTNDELAERFFASLGVALNAETLDTPEFYGQVSFFLDLLQAGRLQIKKTVDPNHAKLYYFQLTDSAAQVVNAGGRFITGSSNLTYAGLHGQQEFNVEIGDYGWEDAEKYFDDLWQIAVPITDRTDRKTDLVHFIRNRTQVAQVSPFEAYVLVLKAYLDLVKQKAIKPHVIRLLEERGYIAYQYQMDAVNQALSIIDQYNGVIVADVVGLGKSVIACMLARHMGKRGMVICPPGLMGDQQRKDAGWYRYLEDFQLYGWEVRSTGALEKAADYLQTYGDDVDVIIVDEAHRFRNEDTESYEWLSTICRNRKVILLTATPFNNRPSDIFSLLKLFIIPGKSKITLDEDLEARFSHYNADFRRLSYIMRYHDAGGDKQARAERYYVDLFDAPLPIDLARVKRQSGQLADEIRAVLEPVLIRRNRLDLKNDPIYSREVTQLSDVEDPHELYYELTPEQSRFYDRIVNDEFGPEGRFRGAIYQPFVYEKGRGLDEDTLDEAENRAFQQQRNLYDFMRRLLVKRFESSFGAFKQSIDNFIHAHECVLAFIENSGGSYILDRNLIEKIYQDDPEEIEAALEDFARQLAEQKERPKHDRVYHVPDFDLAEQFVQDIQTDLELLKEIRARIDALQLVEYNGKNGAIKDPKARRLVEQLKQILTKPPAPGEPKRKAVIFSEYVDTVLYLQPILENAFPGKVLSIPGEISKTAAKQLLYNFDASVDPDKQVDQFDILLTSDKLAEGVNLNRAGAVIDYDIPWNPTRVIQRVGRINRIGRKVFQTLHIYNFFPTEQGANIVKSREIASQKMFIIHNTLGEDAKIFDVDETPSPSELFKRVNRNPEDEEQESLLTRIRQRFEGIQNTYPEVVERAAQFPARVKTAKAGDANQLVVFRRKGLGFFIQGIEDTCDEKPEVCSLLFEEALPWIACPPDEQRLDLSERFWPAYQTIKAHRDVLHVLKAKSLLRSRLRTTYKALYAITKQNWGTIYPLSVP